MRSVLYQRYQLCCKLTYRHTLRRDNVKLSTAVLAKPNTDKKPTDDEAIALNGKLAKLNHNKFSQILGLFESNRFNHVNFSTALSRLSNAKNELRHEITNDQRFKDMIRDLNDRYITKKNKGMVAMGVRSVATILHSLAKLQVASNVSAKMLKTLEDQRLAMWLVDKGTPQTISMTCWAAAKLKTPCPALFAQVEKEAGMFVQEASPQAIANTVWAFAKLRVASPNLFQSLRDPSLFDKDGFLPQNLSSLAWACAVNGSYVPAVFDALEKSMLLNGHLSHPPQAISNAAWAYATLEAPIPKVLQELYSSDTFLKSASPHELAQVIWAVATSRTDSPALCEFIAESNVVGSESTSPQSISMILWSLALVGHKAPRFVEKLEEHVDWFLREASVIDRCNVLWACAKLELPVPRLLAAVEAEPIAYTLPRQIANAIWSYGKQGESAPNHLKQLDVDWLVREGNPHDLANCVWACAKGVTDETASMKKIFTALDGHAPWIVKEGTEQTISTCAWACGTMQVYPAKFFDAVLSNLSNKDFFSSPQAIANILWACGTLNIECPKLTEGLLEHRKWFVESAGQQELVNSLYGLVLLGIIHDPTYEPLLTDMWEEMLKRIQREGCATEMASQILYIDCIARVEELTLAPIGSDLRSHLSSLLPSSPPQSSGNSERISEMLTSWGWKHECEVPLVTDGALLAIDMANGEDCVAVEYNGHKHFVRGTDLVETKKVNGATNTKERTLSKLGWKLVSLDWREEREHRDDSDWLKGKMEEVGVSFSGSSPET